MRPVKILTSTSSSSVTSCSVSASAVISGIDPPVGGGVGQPTYGMSSSVMVDGPCCAFHCSVSRAWDVPYGWNRRVLVCPVLVGPNVDWIGACTFCFKKGTCQQDNGKRCEPSTYLVGRASQMAALALPPVAEWGCS